MKDCARLTWRERLGYGCGDLGFNLYWTTIASFLAAFYTDTFGIAASAAGTMLLVTKLLDAVTDPIMGALADRTRSRFGKFRPYLLFAGIPMAGAAVLTFTTPPGNQDQKLLFAYVSYSLMMLTYTVLSTPYSALSGVMTSDSQERTVLVSTRFAFAFGGAFLVNRFTLPLVAGLGGADDALGFQRTMLLYGVVATLTFVITFATTRERIVAAVDQQSDVLRDVRDLFDNRPWMVLFGLALLVMLTFTLRGGSAYYYFKYHVGRPELISSYLGVQAVAYACGAISAPWMTRYLGKVTLLMALLCLVGVLSAALYFVPKEQTVMIFALNILISFALGPKSPLTWSMYADTADYNEYKTGRRATAMTFAAATFSQKLGGALGSAGMLWVLGMLGYAANEAQTGASVRGIVALQTLIPGAFAIVGALLVRSYTLSEKDLALMHAELRRRKA